MSRRKLTRAKRIMKNTQRNTKSIKEVGRTQQIMFYDSEPLLIIKGYNQYVPDGVYYLSVNGNDMYKYQYFMLTGDNKDHGHFPKEFERILSNYW